MTPTMIRKQNVPSTDRRAVGPGSGSSGRQPTTRKHERKGGDATRKGERRDPGVPKSFPRSAIPAVNVASVRLWSPLRYPGGKTWLIPHVQAWLGLDKPRVLFEPFCGGGIVSLTAAMEKLCERAVLVELDRDVAAFWHAALRHTDDLCKRIRDFDPSRENVRALELQAPANLVDQAFRTLVLNRTRRGGILAPGASLIRAGESGKGVASRWYAQTIVDRLSNIKKHEPRITFLEGDGLKLLESMVHAQGVAVFVDPPYTAGGKRAGRRLYAHHEVDHSRIFEVLADSNADFLMTYERTPEIVALVQKHGFAAVTVTMKNAHHSRVPELVISRREMFREDPTRNPRKP